MKLIIQIPCLNEEETLPVTLSHLPREVPGVDLVEWLVIDDGSTDRTVQIAREHGVDHIVRHLTNRGLAEAFSTGLENCLRLGADIIVNTDGDNQYRSSGIAQLVKPIIDEEHDMVIGVRPIESIEHFSAIKKFLQKLGSWVVRLASNTSVPDATSGFRAFSRDAAQRLHVFSTYTYTLETIIQAGQKRMAIGSVPVETNEMLRGSRLISSIPRYIAKSLVTIVRISVTYRPFLFFMLPAVISGILGSAIFGRFLYFYAIGQGQGKVQSLILGALLVGLAVLLAIFGLVADLVAVNRKLLERIDWRLQSLADEVGKTASPAPDESQPGTSEQAS